MTNGRFAIVKINVSKFEFYSTEVIARFASLEEARAEYDSDSKWSDEVNGWSDGYTHRVFEILEDGSYRHPDGRPFAPQQGDIILGWL
jgi:hypothetical protein